MPLRPSEFHHKKKIIGGFCFNTMPRRAQGPNGRSETSRDTTAPRKQEVKYERDEQWLWFRSRQPVRLWSFCLLSSQILCEHMMTWSKSKTFRLTSVMQIHPNKKNGISEPNRTLEVHYLCLPVCINMKYTTLYFIWYFRKSKKMLKTAEASDTGGLSVDLSHTSPCLPQFCLWKWRLDTDLFDVAHQSRDPGVTGASPNVPTLSRCPVSGQAVRSRGLFHEMFYSGPSQTKRKEISTAGKKWNLNVLLTSAEVCQICVYVVIFL